MSKADDRDEILAALETYVATVEYIFPENQYTGRTRLAHAHAIARKAIAAARAADVPDDAVPAEGGRP